MIKKRNVIKILICIFIILAVLAFFFLDNVIYYFNYELTGKGELNVDVFTPYNFFGNAPTVAHVRMTALKHNFSHAKRSEYCFEVIEWIKGGNGKKNISVYSDKRYDDKAWGWMEYERAFDYKVGNEYILCLEDDPEYYKFSIYLYFPIDNYEKKAYSWGQYFIDLNFHYNMPSGLSKEEVVDFIRMLSYLEE